MILEGKFSFSENMPQYNYTLVLWSFISEIYWKQLELEYPFFAPIGALKEGILSVCASDKTKSKSNLELTLWNLGLSIQNV